MCTTCSDRYNVVICDGCNARRIRGNRILAWRQLGHMMGVFVLCSAFFNWLLDGNSIGADAFTQTVGAMVLGVGGLMVSVGWRTAGEFTPRMMVFFPVIGLPLFILLKVAIAVVAGILLVPYRIISSLYTLYQMGRLRRRMQSARRRMQPC
jgi:hypothetical protein